MDGADHYRNVVVVDFEYEIVDGDLPRVLCMVAYVLDAESAPRKNHPTLAWRIRLGAAIRYRAGYAGGRAIACGRR